MTDKPTRGARNAAEIITGRTVDLTGADLKTYRTLRGEMTALGMANLIDDKTGAPDMLAMLRDLAGIMGPVDVADTGGRRVNMPVPLIRRLLLLVRTLEDSI